MIWAAFCIALIIYFRGWERPYGNDFDMVPHLKSYSNFSTEYMSALSQNHNDQKYCWNDETPLA